MSAPRRNENGGKSQQIEGVYIPGDRKINSARRLKTCFLVSAQSSLVQKKKSSLRKLKRCERGKKK